MQGNQTNDVVVTLVKDLSKASSIGRLQLRGSQGSVGVIYFDAGQVVHARYKNDKGTSALFKMLLWKSEGYRFSKGVPSSEQSITTPTDILLAEFEAGKTAHLQEQVNVPEPARNQGSISPAVDASFLQDVTELTCNIMGPAGDILVDESLETLGIKAHQLSEEHVGLFIQALGQAFDNLEWRSSFTHQVRDLCQRYKITLEN